MFFSSKPKGYFVEQSDHAVLLARTSSPVAPMVIEELRICPAGDADAIAEAIHIVQPKPGPSGYMNACCGVYPAKRLVRRASLEMKRLKEPSYFPELLTTQFRIEPDKYTIHVINAVDGTDYDVDKATQKEVLFCGVPSDDIVVAQDALLAAGIYPDQLELGSGFDLGRLGGLFRLHEVQDADAGPRDRHGYHAFVHCFVGGVEASRPIPQGLDAMVPIVQKELGLEGRGVGQEIVLFEHL